jgi:hypothetical protein
MHPTPERSDPRRIQTYSSNHDMLLAVGIMFLLHFAAILGLSAAVMYGGCGMWAPPKAPPLAEVIDAGGGGEPEAAEPSNVRNDPKHDATIPNATSPFVLPNFEEIATPMPVREEKAVSKPSEPSKGIDGPGSGGGLGSGMGPGISSGSDLGMQNARAERMYRWEIKLPFGSSTNYLAKLENLGATVVAYHADGKYTIYRNLTTKRGESISKEDLEKFNKMLLGWWDTKTDSVAALAIALNVKPIPTKFRIYFPVELEKAVAEAETSYRNLTEQELVKRNLHTSFSVRRIGDRYEVTVVEQKPK